MGKFEGTDFDNVDQKLTIGDIRGSYTAWRSRWNKGREWGIVGGAIGGDPKPDTVLDQVLEHGDSTYARDQARSIEGLGKMLESLTEIFDGDVIETSHVDQLQKDIDGLMSVLSDKKWNPRNIPFTTVIEFTETDDPKKPIIKRGEVFGHYRTKAYNQYVEWAKENKKNFRGQLANSEDEWYDEKRGKAKPPLWQAITGEGETEFGKNGILAIARNAIKSIKKIKVGDSTRIAVFNNARGPAQLAQIKSVQEKVIQVLQNPSIYPAGKSRAPMKDRLNAAFTNETYAIRNKQEAELLNFAKGFDRVEGIEKLKGVQLRFPSNNLALNKTIKLVLQNLGEELQQYMTPKAKDGTSKPGLVLKQLEGDDITKAPGIFPVAKKMINDLIDDHVYKWKSGERFKSIEYIDKFMDYLPDNLTAQQTREIKGYRKSPKFKRWFAMYLTNTMKSKGIIDISEPMVNNYYILKAKKRKFHAWVDEVMSDGKERDAQEVRDSTYDLLERKRNNATTSEEYRTLGRVNPSSIPNSRVIAIYLRTAKDESGNKKYLMTSEKPTKYKLNNNMTKNINKKSDNMSWKEILKYCGKEKEDPWHETEPPLPAANIENLSSKQKKIAEQAEPKDKITGEDFKRLKNKKSKGRSAFTAQD